MFTIFWSFLRAHWQTALLASCIGTVSATFLFQRIEIRHLDAKLSQCHAENVVLEDSNQALLAAIRDQNLAIASLNVLAKKKHDAAVLIVARARRQAAVHEHKAAVIKAEATEQNDCSSLRRLVKEFVP